VTSFTRKQEIKRPLLTRILGDRSAGWFVAGEKPTPPYHPVRRKTQRRIFGDGPRIPEVPRFLSPDLRNFLKYASYCPTDLFK
jgi:hypothetical protein